MNKRPCLLIVPLMSLEEAKAWKSGVSYSALICAGGYNGGDAILNVSSQTVHKDTLSIFFHVVQELNWMLRQACFPTSRRVWLRLYQQVHVWITGCPIQQGEDSRRTFLNGSVHVPVLRERLIFNPLIVAKIRFDQSDTALPSPPDPFLLAVKAAIIWNWRNGEKLLPGSFIPKGDEWSVGDEIMREDEEGLHQAQIRPKIILKLPTAWAWLPMMLLYST